MAVAVVSTLASTAYLSAGDDFGTPTENVCACIGSNPPGNQCNKRLTVHYFHCPTAGLSDNITGKHNIYLTASYHHQLCEADRALL